MPRRLMSAVMDQRKRERARRKRHAGKRSAATDWKPSRRRKAAKV